MKFCKKTISILISIALFTADAPFLYADSPAAYKLAPASKFSRMQGTEFKEAAQIELNVRDILKHMTTLDLESLRGVGLRRIKEKTIFGAGVTGRVSFDRTREICIKGAEVRHDRGSYIVEAGIGNKIYYCLISISRSGASGKFEISVIPGRLVREAAKSGTVSFTHDSMNAKDRGILDAYIEHEASSDGRSAVDEWIAARMMRGKYAVDSSAASGKKAVYSSPGKVYDVRNYLFTLMNIEGCMRSVGVGQGYIDPIMKKMKETPLVLIPYDDEIDLPVITINGNDIRVKAHSSEFATYIFVRKRAYNAVREHDPAGSNEKSRWNREIEDYIEEALVHEIGARCGMNVRVETNSRGKSMRLRNALDDAYTLYMNEREPARLSLPDDISRELSRLAPVDLSDLSKRHDYAAGEAVSPKAMKAGFMKRMLLALAGIAILNSVTGCPPKSPTTPPLPTPNTQGPITPGPAGPRTQKPSTPAQNPNLAAPDYGFANKYTIEEVVRDPQKADAFMKDYCALIARYIAVGIQDGIAIDGWNVDSNTLERRDARFWTAASKDSLYLAILIKLLKGDKYAMILFGITDPAAAKQEAARRFAENISGWEQFDRDNPVYGGMPTWVKTEGGRRTVANLADLPEEMQRYNAMLKAKLEYRRVRSYFPQGAGFSVESIMPTSDWRNRFPVLDAGEWIWPVYTAYHELKKAGEADLAARYEARFRKIMGNIVDMVWDKGLQKVRAEVRIVDTTLRTVDPANYINNIAGYYLDDPFEGIMIAHLLKTFKEYTGKPAAEIDAIIQKLWDDIKMKLVSTPWGMIYEGWPVTTNPPDSAVHINWPNWFTPILDDLLALQVAINREVARTQVNKYGFPSSVENPDMPGNYTGYNDKILTPYGATHLLLLYANHGDVTRNNFALAWLLNMLKVDRMVAKDGVLDAFSVNDDGTLRSLSFLHTADNQLNPVLAMMGGIVAETREALKADSLTGGPHANRYERFMARANTEYTETFGSLAAIGGKPLESADFRMPTPVMKTAYKPVVNPPTEGTVNLLNMWKFPGIDKWGDKMEFRTEGKKVIITNIAKPPDDYGHAWAGGGLREMITPKAGSAIYLKGTGSFTLKLEGTKPGFSGKYPKEIPVTLEGDDKWVKVSLVGEEGATFGVIVIDRIQFGATVAIADMVYSPGAAASVAQLASAETRSARYQKHQIGRISEVSWLFGTGAITAETARGQLAFLAPRIGGTPSGRDAAYAALLNIAAELLARMGHRRHEKPVDIDIKAIGERIKEMGIDVFIPASQIKNDMRGAFRDELANIFGDSLRPYERPEQLEKMVTSPEKSIIMTTGLSSEMIEIVNGFAPKIREARFVNLAAADVDNMPQEVYENYIAETLSLLLAARVITKEEAGNAQSGAYKFLAHLLEPRLEGGGNLALLASYIKAVVDDSADVTERLTNLLKITLKAVPIEEYKVTKPAVQVLWSA